MPATIPNFNFLARLVSEIWGIEGGPKIKSGSSWFPQTPPSGQIFIQGAIVRVNAYKCDAKFKLPSSISYWDMEGWQNKNGAANPLRRTVADKFLHVTIVPGNAYQRTKFQLSSSNSFGGMRASQHKKWELLISPDVPHIGQMLIPGASTRKWLQVCQISTS